MSEPRPASLIAALIDEHYELVYRYAYRLTGQASDAEDLTQQTFLTAQNCWEQLRELQAVKGWLCTIVRNAYLKSRRHTVVSLPTLELPDDCPTSTAPFDIDPEELQETLKTLPEEYQTPLVLFYFQALSYKELADMLNVPLGTIMSRLSRGKALLRKRLLQKIERPDKVAAGTDSRPVVIPKK